MKEKLACSQCPEIVCADIEEGKKVIGQPGERRWVTFPENVEACPRRPKPEFDNILGWIEGGTQDSQ